MLTFFLDEGSSEPARTIDAAGCPFFPPVGPIFSADDDDDDDEEEGSLPDVILRRPLAWGVLTPAWDVRAGGCMERVRVVELFPRENVL